MTTWIKRTVVVTAANAPLARSLAEGIAGVSGSGMFKTELAPTEAGPATHYVNSGHFWDSFAALMIDANAMFQAAGGQVTLEQCQALVSQSDVSDVAVESPFAAFARLGLTMVRVPL